MQRIYNTILFLCTLLPLSAQEVEGNVQLGQGMPVFKIIHDDYSELTFSPYINKIILVVFFQTFCESCVQELTDIEKQIWPHYKELADFILLPIGVSHNDKELHQFKKEKDLDIPLYPDPVGEIFNVFALGEEVPRTYLVDKTNKIIFLREGYSAKNLADLKKILHKAVMAEPIFDEPLQPETTPPVLDF